MIHLFHQRSALFVALVVAAALACLPSVSAQTKPQAQTQTPAKTQGQAQPKTDAQAKTHFRVCADPENMPFSNDKLEGFENKIAELLAKEFQKPLSYVWWGQRHGFIRNTMNATLEEGRCEFVMGVPDKYDLVMTTRPYYRSTYVFVYPKGKLTVHSLDDPILKKLKIGVHLLGDDYTNPPPVHELSKRGIVGNVVGYSTFYSSENPASTIIDAVAAGKIDVAVVWGPIAGYYATKQKVPLQVVPIPSKKGDLPSTFDISMGVKRGNEPLLKQLQQILDKREPEITAILRQYGVPLVEKAQR